MLRFLLVVPVVVALGCGAAHRAGDDDVDHDGAVVDASAPDAMVDAPPPDAVECGGIVCNELDARPTPACLDEDTLATYDGRCEDGTGECTYEVVETECGAIGCCTDHCCGVLASNAAETGTPAVSDFMAEPPTGSTFDTDDGCEAASLLGDCGAVPRAGLGDACVCRADYFTIANLRVVGSRPLVLFATRSVAVNGTLDVSGDLTRNGPGGEVGYASGVTGSAGGAGGSYATAGGGGAALPFGTETITPLVGGRQGQATAVAGGGGGGAIQIVALDSIQVDGAINAGGGGGGAGVGANANFGGAGGGSGGSVLLEAKTVTVAGSVAANGGGGGGAGGSPGNGAIGTDATTPTASTLGGQGRDGGSCVGGTAAGGDGGAGAKQGMPAGGGQAADIVACTLGTAYVGEGGGGGGLGRIRINTAAGCACGGSFSPTPSTGTVAKQ